MGPPPTKGYEILAPVPIPEAAKLAIRHSHERWDGTGYPDGLAGNEIPIGARVILVADAYEAMVTDRPYRRGAGPPPPGPGGHTRGGKRIRSPSGRPVPPPHPPPDRAVRPPPATAPP